MKERDFYELVERALEGVPLELSQYLENIVIVVDDWPEKHMLGESEDDTLYGLYEGVPITERGSDYYGLPDRITIFRGPLERDFPAGELEEEIRVTVIHEIAHYFGFDEARISELGWG
ncbi:MAG: metallopeptidase family protein [Actinomycetota bacterium]|nr:metallopeptidase family protein [Actinomycetota bacterium]